MIFLMGTGGKAAGAEADYSPPSVDEVGNGGAMSLLPAFIFMAWRLIN
jgi:hypothetical protein